MFPGKGKGCVYVQPRAICPGQLVCEKFVLRIVLSLVGGVGGSRGEVEAWDAT